MSDATGSNARWYLTGTAASLLGDGALSLVAGIWVKSLTGSNAQAGLASACAYAATLLAPVGGLLADRMGRRPLLLVANAVAAAVAATLLLVDSAGDVWLVLAVMATLGLVQTVVDPAEAALFAELFDADARRRLNGRRLAIQETGRLLSPLLGAGLFAALGGGAVAALDAATFLEAAFVVTRLPTGTSTPAPPEPSVRRRSALTAGVRHVLATPELRPIALAVVAVMAISGVGVATQYAVVTAIGQRPAFLGALSAALGAGSVLASLVCGRLIARFGERRVAVVGILDLALGDGLRCVASLPIVLAASVVLGFALPFAFLAVLSAAQRATPDALQGRVSAALSLALFGPQAAVQALGALLIVHVSYVAILAGSAVACLIVAAALAVNPACRTGRRRARRHRRRARR